MTKLTPLVADTEFNLKGLFPPHHAVPFSALNMLGFPWVFSEVIGNAFNDEKAIRIQTALEAATLTLKGASSKHPPSTWRLTVQRMLARYMGSCDPPNSLEEGQADILDSQSRKLKLRQGHTASKA